MNRAPFLYRDFVRAKETVRTALCQLDETYVLVTGDTGTGKTMLLRTLKADLDRARYRVFYFAEARMLTASAFVRVVAKALRARTSNYHSESLDQLVKCLADEQQKVLLWFDEAHELPEETLGEAKALAESDLEGKCKVQILLVGLPPLRQTLQALPHLWRRVVVREEMTGLQSDELPAFLEHHFGAAQQKRLCEQGLSKLFERGKGSPGVLMPMCRRLFAAATHKGRIEPEQVDDVLHRWDLA
jgi:type II secretory pathway predicted ATPase ExeA